MRTSFVQINGQLYEKAGDNSVIIAGERWTCYMGTWAPEGTHGASSPAAMIMPDIAPYRSTIDGSEITSRSRHREHLREHNCIEVGNERPKPRQETWTATRGLREELIARYNS